MREHSTVFPVFDSVLEGTDCGCVDYGMSLRQYAAIKLRVPRSGDPDIDAMIRESRRADFAEAALVGAFKQYDHPGKVSDYAFDIADAMLEDWMKENGK
jgi:hypothetical protein